MLARRRTLLGIALLALPFAARVLAPATAATPVPAFTANIAADTGYLDPGGTRHPGPNEPQVAVDETGMTYITWQSSSRMAKTRDGQHFQFLGNPDTTQVTDSGDVAVTTTSWGSPTRTVGVGPAGSQGIFWSHLGAVVGCPTVGGPINIRASASADQGKTWNASNASCQPAQTDRNWIAAYTPPQFRGTPDAVKNTYEYQIYHDFGVSAMWLVRSLDGGTTWDPIQHNAVQPGSQAQLTSLNNSIPGGVAVDHRGKHPGRVFVEWSSSDVSANLFEGGNITQAEPFDHIFLSYSDDFGQTWKSSTVFNDPCSPNPPATTPAPVNNCQDVSELFTPLAVDDAGNPWVTFIWRDVSKAQPEYDLYLTHSFDGGDTWERPTRVRTDPSLHTHYMPWIVAGSAGNVDLVYYASTYLQGVGNNGKPGASPRTATWNVFMSQTMDSGQSWVTGQVSDHINYFGDICSVGIFCDQHTGQVLNSGPDRVLLDDFGVAIGPDGGARIAWTDTRESMTGQCTPQGSSAISCQSAQRHVYFACQTAGTGLHGEGVTGCGQSVQPAAVIPSVAQAVPAPSTLPLTAVSGRLPGVATIAVGLFAIGLLGVVARIGARRRGFRSRGPRL